MARLPHVVRNPRHYMLRGGVEFSETLVLCWSGSLQQIETCASFRRL